MNRSSGSFFSATVALDVGRLGASRRASPHGRAERRDSIFLRFPEMAERYWVEPETNAASHKVIAVPLAAAVRVRLCRLLSQG